jgi:hypothetical protein
MTKVVCLFSLLLVIVFTTNSCKKTTESELMNGIWQVNTVNVDTAGSNYLNVFPNFAGCSNCAYKLSFQDQDVVIAYYISNDSIKHLATGTWTVPDYTKVTIKVDNFIDGTFSITRPLLSHWVLTSNFNHIAAFDNGVNPQFDTCYTKIDMIKL